MSLIVILVETEYSAADLAAAHAAIGAVASASRGDAGCLSYTVATDLENSAITRVSEVWASAEHHRAHMKMPHVAAFFAAISGLQVVRRDFRMFEIARELELALPGPV